MEDNNKRLNLVSLKDYVDTRFCDLRIMLDERFSHQQRAMDKSSEALGIRLVAMNEFRDQINKERSEYVTRKELELMLDPMKSNLNFNKGRNTTILVLITLGIALASLIVAIIK